MNDAFLIGLVGVVLQAFRAPKAIPSWFRWPVGLALVVGAHLLWQDLAITSKPFWQGAILTWLSAMGINSGVNEAAKVAGSPLAENKL